MIHHRGTPCGSLVKVLVLFINLDGIIVGGSVVRVVVFAAEKSEINYQRPSR